MDCVAVTLHHSKPRQRKDLLLPLDLPQYMLVDRVLEALSINVAEDLQPVLATVTFNSDNQIIRKDRLPLQASLRDVGIRFGQHMLLEFEQNKSRLSLICLQGPVFHIHKDEISIGCRKGLDVDLSTVPNQEFVSSFHAKVWRREQSYYLADAGSTNGTSLNGRVIAANKEYPLKDGDTILLGAETRTGVELIVKVRKFKGDS